MSGAGPSNSDQGKRKRRGRTPLWTPDSSGVKKEIESQETKRHRTDEGGAGVGNQVALPIQKGHPGAVLLQQDGNGGPPGGGRMRADPGNELVPASSRSGRTPPQWAEAMPNRLGFGTGTSLTSAKDVSYIGRAAHQVAAFSPSGLVDFVISPAYEENRLPKLDQTRAQRKAGIEDAVRLPFDRRGRQPNARGWVRGRGGGNGSGRDPAAAETVTRELSENDKKQIAEAVLFVFSAEKDVDMSGSDCDSCKKTTHKTGHCPEPSYKCDTAVDNFCDSTIQRGHSLDPESMFNGKGDLIGCKVLVEHFEMNHMVDLFIHLVLYRIHKPPLRVRSERFCWIDVLIQFADTFCDGQMPAAIVETGGLLPYTKNDVASYKSELQRFDEIGAKEMPPGELDGKTIEEIKTMRRNRRLRRQIYAVYGERHSADKLQKLSAIQTSDCPENVEGASKPAIEEEVQPGGAPQGV